MSIKIISCALCGCDFEKTGRRDKYCINCRATARKIREKRYVKNRNKGIYNRNSFTKEKLIVLREKYKNGITDEIMNEFEEKIKNGVILDFGNIN